MSQSKIALITGGTRGLGLESAKQLAGQVSTIIITGRNKEQLDEVASKWTSSDTKLDTIVMDVENSKSIEAAAAYVATHYGKLDILINNAGVILEGAWGQNSTLTTDIATFKRTFDINYFGLIEVTHAFLPLVRKVEQGRIVNVSSILGSLATQTNPESPFSPVKVVAYNSSKSAVNSYTVHLAQALLDTNIKVNAAHPGWVKTELGTQDAPMDVADGAKTQVELALLDEDGPTGGFFHLGDVVAW
jgi:NAD(P)-dependent dehydrogenase (short-subunit alcohol dehydrogenase family)